MAGKIRSFTNDTWPGLLLIVVLCLLGPAIQLLRAHVHRSVYTETYDIRDVMIYLPDPYFPEEVTSYRELVEQISSLIEDVVEPSSWRRNGGIGEIDLSQTGYLVITQSHEKHLEILKLMDQLRETRAWYGPPFYDFDWRYFRRK